MTRYLAFAAVSLVLLLSAISGTAVAVAFPVITSSLDASLILAGWVLSAYQLVITTTMPLAGKASDVFGRKFIFMLSLSFFILGSLLCAVAPNIQLLILSRVIQGIGGGGFLPSAAGIVAEQFPKSRQQALGLFTSIYPIGMIIGPNLGGWMTSALGWRSVFWLNIPLGLVALVAAALLLRSGQQRAERHIDLIGAGLFTGSLFAILAGLSQMGNGGTGLSWVLTGILFAAGLVFMVVFLRHESRARDPILDLEVIRARPFVAANVFNFIYGAGVFGLFSFIPLYAVSVYGMSILASGLILTPRSVGMMLASAVTSIFLVRWGYRRPMLLGTSVVILCLVLLSIESQGVSILGMQLSSTVLLLAIMGLLGLGMGTAAPAANNACIELMPQRVATITGIRGMFRMAGGAVSIGVTSLLLNNIGDMARGFYIVFLGLAIVLLITIPAIFVMPGSAEVPPSVRDARQPGR
ncbi:MAG: MFS transporter [Chloroflexi bacterium]|nr:MFS transporter [Chloroflexota bacterium]